MYCPLLDIQTEQQERVRTIHITVQQISQSSRRGLEQYTLLSIRYLRVVGEGQNNTHQCLLDISEQYERARTIHITVYQFSALVGEGQDNTHEISSRYLRVVVEGQNNTHYYSIRYLRVVGEGQNNTHYCLLDISDSRRGLEQYTLLLLGISEQQERARTIHISVYSISQSSRRGLEQYTLLSIRYLTVGRRRLEQYTLLSIDISEVVGKGQSNTHQCLLGTTLRVV